AHSPDEEVVSTRGPLLTSRFMRRRVTRGRRTTLAGTASSANGSAPNHRQDRLCSCAPRSRGRLAFDPGSRLLQPRCPFSQGRSMPDPSVDIAELEMAFAKDPTSDAFLALSAAYLEQDRKSVV